jgi:hypothetical protein
VLRHDLLARRRPDPWTLAKTAARLPAASNDVTSAMAGPLAFDPKKLFVVWLNARLGESSGRAMPRRLLQDRTVRELRLAL